MALRMFRAYFDRCVQAVCDGGAVPDPAAVLQRLEGLVLQLPPDPATRPAPGKLSVALICREYPPDSAYGGMATYTYRLACGLVEAGHRVTIIALGTPSARRELDGRADVIRIAPRPRSERRSFEALALAGQLTVGPAVFFWSLAASRQLQEVEQAHGPFDVIDLADYAADGLWPALRWHGPKTVRLYTPLSMLAAMRFQPWPARDTDSVAVLEGMLMRRADGLTTASQDLADRAVTFFGLAREVEIVPSPVDLSVFRPGSRRDDRVRVCFVGRLDQRKGADVLLEAIPLVLARNPAVEFRIVGRDSLLLADRTDRSFDHRVRFEGPVPLGGVATVYQESDIAVVPSYYDNAPFTCVEAMASGIPVIGTNAGGMPEYVVDGESGIIIPPGDPLALAAAIVRLAGDAPLRRRLGSAARVRAEKRFDHRQVAEQMEAHYRALMARAVSHSSRRPDSRPQLDRRQPERNGVELFVLARRGERGKLRRTLATVVDQPVAVTILSQGRRGPRVFGTTRLRSPTNAWKTAATAISTTTEECVSFIRAGARLEPGAIDRALCQLVLQGTGFVQVAGVPVLVAATIRGFRYPAESARWEVVLDTLARAATTRAASVTAPPIPDWSRDQLQEVPLIGDSGTAALVGWLRASALRPLLGWLRDALSRVPGGRSFLAYVLAPTTSLVFPARRRLGRRQRWRPVVVAGTLTSAHDHAQSEQLPSPELWALQAILPPPLWAHAVCYLLRTRPRGSVRLAPEMTTALLPPDYRSLLADGHSAVRGVD